MGLKELKVGQKDIGRRYWINGKARQDKYTKKMRKSRILTKK
jgi:hypothetical protein